MAGMIAAIAAASRHREARDLNLPRQHGIIRRLGLNQVQQQLAHSLPHLKADGVTLQSNNSQSDRVQIIFQFAGNQDAAMISIEKGDARILGHFDRNTFFNLNGAGTDITRRILVAMVRRELETLHAEMKMKPDEDLKLTGEVEHWLNVDERRGFFVAQHHAVTPVRLREVMFGI